MTFKREFDRYFVLKNKDVDNLPKPLLTRLDDIISDIQKFLPERQYVVVESDWPEYEVVWKMIEDRCKND